MNKGRWKEGEHQRFLAALAIHGKEWRAIAETVGTRSKKQVKSHHQKWSSHHQQPSARRTNTDQQQQRDDHHEESKNGESGGSASFFSSLLLQRGHHRRQKMMISNTGAAAHDDSCRSTSSLSDLSRSQSQIMITNTITTHDTCRSTSSSSDLSRFQSQKETLANCGASTWQDNSKFTDFDRIISRLQPTEEFCDFRWDLIEEEISQKTCEKVVSLTTSLKLEY
mmetsp:Transcript_55741/g.81453  ORF Transcript_55741/g.81453 Transcript_55741/m.81453 type:complete len:224 (-) Transcript_55741:204-875(-)